MKLAARFYFIDEGYTQFISLKNPMNESKLSNAEIRNTSMAIHDIFLETEVLSDMTASERQIAAKQRGRFLCPSCSEKELEISRDPFGSIIV
jgi:hypothetical protein